MLCIMSAEKLSLHYLPIDIDQSNENITKNFIFHFGPVSL